ncbi:hypothetical protein GCM10010909_11240 [Acidocella aquatica]|uniref:DUF952 domain-containing protein n=1 Tax=Acidocella aquatica TaxID=1922313 RepID=A0ABQ6A1U2_9PROT|nr:DUF952 domain-containing protein [Acidocella aquatica]GLR66444.1 hypothetical protein GCM10010909_11240 [Acidocella aquatica]
MNDAIAYKILTGTEFAALKAGVFDGAPVDQADGYIHLSTAAQVRETVDRHFAGQDNLVAAAVDLAALGEAVRWEVSRGGQKFPHLYGRLSIAAVVAHAPLARAADGSVKLP